MKESKKMNMRIQTDSRKLFLALAGGTGTRQQWVPAHGRAAGPCSLPVLWAWVEEILGQTSRMNNLQPL